MKTKMFIFQFIAILTIFWTGISFATENSTFSKIYAECESKVEFGKSYAQVPVIVCLLNEIHSRFIRPKSQKSISMEGFEGVMDKHRDAIDLLVEHIDARLKSGNMGDQFLNFMYEEHVANLADTLLVIINQDENNFNNPKQDVDLEIHFNLEINFPEINYFKSEKDWIDLPWKNLKSNYRSVDSKPIIDKCRGRYSEKLAEHAFEPVNRCLKKEIMRYASITMTKKSVKRGAFKNRLDDYIKISSELYGVLYDRCEKCSYVDSRKIYIDREIERRYVRILTRIITRMNQFQIDKNTRDSGIE
ncbi:MAG: hypothetical protein HQL63_13380 [Magnetococcales bacterium]|nr:hypothetical protein [Magnetococcales bacterium]